jgi:hypothetical protein
MPVAIVDTEQAQLINVALEMLEGALTARSTRVDPEQIITKALQLQAYKLATVRKLLLLPDPPPFAQLEPRLRNKALHMADLLRNAESPAEAQQAWDALRGIANAPALPAAT